VDRFDALIIGGGPAGATAAILLAEAGWSVALVERKAFPRRKVCGEYLSVTNWPLLAQLGIGQLFEAMAGPPVRETAVFVGKTQYLASLPRPGAGTAWGRALPRERFDTLLIERATKVGATLVQPARCTNLESNSDGAIATIEGASGQTNEIFAPVVIAAHGSWEIGGLPTQRQTAAPRPGDWLAFKAHFRNTKLPDGLMPLLCFHGGYGGMVHVGEGRASLSCCIQRRQFERLARQAGESAGETVLTHILESCPVLRPVLDGAVVDGAWLAAGAIQPGIRPSYCDGVFAVGNAAGEAHPVVAEGISMAMQSAWLLAERLIAHRRDVCDRSIRERVARSYSAAWRWAFAPRIHAAAAIAHWASRPWLVRAVGPALRTFPALVTCGARLSGKSRLVVKEGVHRPTECFQG
jgi:flavin-dependent dehydrogenase